MTNLLEAASFLGIDWGKIGYHLYQLGIAFALSLPVALNREHHAYARKQLEQSQELLIPSHSAKLLNDGGHQVVLL